MVQDGPTNTGYGTTNADAGEGIGMLKGIRKNIKQAINSHTYVLWWAIIPKSCLCKEPTYVRKNVIEVTLRASAHPMCMAWSILLRRFQRTLQERVPSHIIPHIPQVANTLQQVNRDFILFCLSKLRLHRNQNAQRNTADMGDHANNNLEHHGQST